ncbi:unnamed protein product [Didymodactylos carnosus]|uniref:Uncharacterized protein n=1 Tax=Didymodactylos carnosus TaxID=1234261 RepID=A0A813YU59_9BILA|nr:unnamed protein product [Didymodactylos carnosus]CAF1078172.1 unnamed protein product [Didymodactylos carnosus]CAF3673525.1 unnamed protein product [Didymodactylos carnosus]CAF3841623.1 unnamed protein product [Didymodactylos carnosus]
MKIVNGKANESLNPRKGDIRVNHHGLEEKFDGNKYKIVCKFEGCANIAQSNERCKRSHITTQLKPNYNSIKTINTSSSSTRNNNSATKITRNRHRTHFVRVAKIKKPTVQNGEDQSLDQILLTSCVNNGNYSPPQPKKRSPSKTTTSNGKLSSLTQYEKGAIVNDDYGVPKKFDGFTLRDICKKDGCFNIAQKNGRCKKSHPRIPFKLFKNMGDKKDAYDDKSLTERVHASVSSSSGVTNVPNRSRTRGSTKQQQSATTIATTSDVLSRKSASATTTQEHTTIDENTIRKPSIKTTTNQNPLSTKPANGDIITLTDGIRKKWNGIQWRKLCSKPACPYYMQSKCLCKQHLLQLQREEMEETPEEESTTTTNQMDLPNSDTDLSQILNDSSSVVLNSTKVTTSDTTVGAQQSQTPVNPVKGDILVLENGVRKKFDGRQYRRLCSRDNCLTLVQGPVYYTNGLCPKHWQENQSNITETDSAHQPQQHYYYQKCDRTSIRLPTNDVEKIDTYESAEKPTKTTTTPFVATSSTSFTSSRKKASGRRAKSSVGSHRRRLTYFGNKVPKPSRRLTVAATSSSVNLDQPTKGDVVILENGSRKKFDGIVWRKTCSLPHCFIAAQKNELCRKHYLQYNGQLDLARRDNQTTTSKSNSSLSDSTREKRGRDTSLTKKSLSRMKHKFEDEENYDNGNSIDMMSSSFDGEEEGEEGEEEEEEEEEEEKEDAKNEEEELDSEENAHSDDDDDLSVDYIENSLINLLSASREKFPTSALKKWLHDHKDNPYPTHDDKINLANLSNITYEQVGTWFNNARAILRRRQKKLRQSTIPLVQKQHQRKRSSIKLKLEPSTKHVANLNRSQFYNGISTRSIGIQCNPSVVNKSTTTNSNIPKVKQEYEQRMVRTVQPSSTNNKNNSNTQTTSEKLSIENKLNVKLSSQNDNDDDDDVNIDCLMDIIPAQSTNGLTWKYDREDEIIITSTCLNDDQIAQLKEFCTKFEIKMSQIVDQTTTHLITDEEDTSLICPLSKKVIQAVARHMYVISYRWINECLRKGKIIDENIYEICGDLTLSPDHNGMQRSRLSVLPKTLPPTLLLDNYSIMIKCDGCQDMMNNDELIELVQLSGAHYTMDSHFSRISRSIIRVVLCEKEYLRNRKEMYDKCVKVGVHFLTPEWFLESLVQYKVQPFHEYQITLSYDR